ncbi:MAG: homoserine dehydrogenase [Acidianus infernus]|uniref:homoserine dehydrogenase n=1 Tax=Acidianus infernus TaxID=12915 RepID=UPI002274A4D3|nr:homoserine dehydrogenase [Acidianus infernus]
MKLLLVGYGNVGKAFRKLLHEKKVKELENVKIAGIVTTRGLMLKDQETFVPDKKINALEALDEVQPDVVVDMASANYKTGEPSLSLYLTALKRGIHVITTNKAPLALKYKEIINTAISHGSKIFFQATVMSGTPSINLYRILPAMKVRKIRGILNGTTNYILTRMSQGLSFNEALKEAQELGYAERDPTLDINGFDAAGKITILSNVYFSKGISINEVKFEGIGNIEIGDALKRGNKIKLIAYADENETYVKPMEITKEDFLYNVDGVNNALEIESEIQKITIVGPGAGPLNAAYGAFSDLILLLRGENLPGL